MSQIVICHDYRRIPTTNSVVHPNFKLLLLFVCCSLTDTSPFTFYHIKKFSAQEKAHKIKA